MIWADGRFRAVWQTGALKASRQVAQVVAFAVAPAVTIATVGISLFTRALAHPPLYDFHGDIWLAGQRILAGRNPYDVSHLSERLLAIQHGASLDPRFALPVYPAPPLVLLSPLTLLPYKVAAALFFVACATAAAASLRIIGVRDWRCYGAMFLSYPVIFGLILGNVTPFLMLGTAVAWRYRGRIYLAALALAAIVVLKLFLWPLLFWMVVTKRSRSAFLAAGLAALLVVAGWAIIGFQGLAEYPHMLSVLSRVESRVAFSPFALAASSGASAHEAMAIALSLGVTILAVAWYASKRPNGDRYAFTICLLAGLAMSPIVWSHYFALLYLPIGLRAPRFALIWLAPAILVPIQEPAGSTAQIVVFLTLAAVVSLFSVASATDMISGLRSRLKPEHGV